MNTQKVHRFGRLQGIAYLFVCQMLVILDNSPLGGLKLEVYAAFLKITHIG